MNKSMLTNLLAAIAVAAGYIVNLPLLVTVGLFALSGAFTNWLAVHMLFEKVPGLYGSGVIPARFEEFKLAIKQMMMQEFFTQNNIQKFLSNHDSQSFQLAPVINKLDFEPAYDSLVDTIQNSQFGSMLAMFGGAEAITPLKEPFIEKIKLKMVAISETETFQQLVKAQMANEGNLQEIEHQITAIIEQRLEELTPQMVKEMVQEMIQKHLGWLVVWGGVFGALFGLASSLIA